MKSIEVLKTGTVLRSSRGTPASRLLKVMRKRLRVARKRARAGESLLRATSGQ